MATKYYKFPGPFRLGEHGRKGRQARSRRAAVMRLASLRKGKRPEPLPALLFQGYDPELVYVECARCGSPVIWEPGRATTLLEKAGIDRIELDPACILLTDGCPACGAKSEYSVRIFRIAGHGATALNPMHGHA